jgi:hypothetical protein
MKKEWMYFIAGAGLAVAIMLVLDHGYSDFEECVIKEQSKIGKPTDSQLGVIYDFCDRFEDWSPEE